ncbi:MAG: MltR family transcriptional regulator [Devosia sp.]
MKKQAQPPEALSRETSALYKVLNGEKNDLAVILIATSFLDACLMTLLENKLLKSDVTNKLLSHRGALGNFMARADVAYVLGLITKSWYADLQVLAGIRNQVAHHHLTLSFADDEIFRATAKLNTYLQGDLSDSEGRTRFTLCVVMLANWLILHSLQARNEATTPRKEPGMVYRRVEGRRPKGEQ